MNDVIILPIN